MTVATRQLYLMLNTNADTVVGLACGTGEWCGIAWAAIEAAGAAVIKLACQQTVERQKHAETFLTGSGCR
jgi:hypothetical protein